MTKTFSEPSGTTDQSLDLATPPSNVSLTANSTNSLHGADETVIASAPIANSTELPNVFSGSDKTEHVKTADCTMDGGDVDGKELTELETKEKNDAAVPESSLSPFSVAKSIVSSMIVITT